MFKPTELLKRCVLLGVLMCLMGTIALGDTIAYWRFDDQGDAEIAANIDDGAGGTVAAGSHLPDSNGQTVWRKAVHDHSGNGNHLTTWEWDWAGFDWSSDVGGASRQVVKALGLPNALSAIHKGCCPAMMTWSEQSLPGGTDIETWSPLEWTIELSFLTRYNNGFVTLVGRDAIGVSTKTGWLANAALYFSVRPGGRLAIEFTDRDGYTHVAETGTGSINTWTWYDVVATSDGKTLKLYKNNTLVATHDIAATGTADARLAVGSGGGPGWEAGTWTVSRGLWNGNHVDRLYGNIDEIRISDECLEKPDFLYGGYDPVTISEIAVPSDLYDPGLPFAGTVGYDPDEEPPLGSEDGGSVWGNGAFYSDVLGSAIGGGRDYTSLRIHLAELIKRRDVRLAQIDKISYWTNMEPSSPIDWQLKIYTFPLPGQSSGWYGNRFNFTRGNSPDGNWDLWDTDTYTVSDIRNGQTGAMTYPNQLLSTILGASAYGTEKIMFLDIIAGYATNSPSVYSYLDAVTITLTDGSEIKLDLEKMRLPKASTHPPINIGTTSVTLAGAVADEGGVPAEYRFRYTPEGGAEQTTPWNGVDGSSKIFLDVEGLLDDTNYTFQFEVRNAAGSDVGDLRSFKTLQAPQVLLSSSAGGSVVEPGEGLVKLVNQGDVLDVNAVAEDGYVFSQWAGTAVDRGLVADPLSPVTSVEVHQALTLKALFSPLPKIVWVTETQDADEDGVYDDQGWIDWLTSEGYTVDVQRDRYLALGDQKDPNDANDYVGELNAASLVIISRSASSGNYDDDANEIAAWNSVMTPLISLSAYHIRNNRLRWIDSSSAVSDNLSFMGVDDPTHPVFNGVPVTDGLVEVVDPLIFGDGYQGTTFVSATDMGNAHVIGSHLLGYAWIAEWDPGVEFYPGSGQVPGGKRMMFMAGTQETRPTYPQGALNLTDAGKQLFLNAIEYMMGFNPVQPDDIFVKHLYTFEDGTARDLVGGADGVLVGDAMIADGALVTVDQDDWMEMPGDVIAINTYQQVSVEAWYTPVANGNPSWSMLAYFGDSVNGLGANGFFITSARGDDKSRAAISVGNTAAPWTAESGADGPEYDDGLLHHMVGTIDDTNISLFIDGQLISSTPLSPTNKISGLSNNLAYLAKGGYSGDPEWIGAIHKFAIYNKALSPAEVLYLYLQGE